MIDIARMERVSGFRRCAEKERESFQPVTQYALATEAYTIRAYTYVRITGPRWARVIRARARRNSAPLPAPHDGPSALLSSTHGQPTEVR